MQYSKYQYFLTLTADDIYRLEKLLVLRRTLKSQTGFNKTFWRFHFAPYGSKFIAFFFSPFSALCNNIYSFIRFCGVIYHIKLE